MNLNSYKIEKQLEGKERSLRDAAKAQWAYYKMSGTWDIPKDAPIKLNWRAA